MKSRLNASTNLMKYPNAQRIKIQIARRTMRHRIDIWTKMTLVIMQPEENVGMTNVSKTRCGLMSIWCTTSVFKNFADVLIAVISVFESAVVVAVYPSSLFVFTSSTKERETGCLLYKDLLVLLCNSNRYMDRVDTNKDL